MIPTPRIVIPRGHEASAMRSPRDSDAVARQWQKHNRIAFQGGADTRAIVKMQRDIEKLRRRVVSQSPEPETPMWTMAWSGDYLSINANLSDLNSVLNNLPIFADTTINDFSYGANGTIFYGCYINDYYFDDATNSMWAIPQNDHTFMMMWIPNIPPDTPHYNEWRGGIVAYDADDDKFYVPQQVLGPPKTFQLYEIDIDRYVALNCYIELGRIKNKTITQRVSGDVWTIWQLCSLLAPDLLYSISYYGNEERVTCKMVGEIRSATSRAIPMERGCIGYTQDANFMYWWMCDPPVPQSPGTDTFFYYNGAQKIQIDGIAYPPDPATPVPSSSNPWRLMSYAPKIQMTLASGAYDSSKKYFRQS